MFAYNRHKRQEFWIDLFLRMSDVLKIDYDNLRTKEVSEFFYLMKHYEQKLKQIQNG